MAGVARARIGHAGERLKERFGLREFDRQHAHRCDGLGRAALRRQRGEGAALQDRGVRPQGFEPEGFQPGTGLIVAAAAGVAMAGGDTRFVPAVGPAAGAGK